jgi:hypothetical protein
VIVFIWRSSFAMRFSAGVAAAAGAARTSASAATAAAMERFKV